MIDPYEKTSVSRNWDKFDKEFNKMIMKYLKATNKNPKDNFNNLRSVLWNKMSNDLITKVKEKEMENENSSNEFFESKNFTVETYYPLSCHKYKGTRRSLIMKLKSKLNFGTDEYALHVQYDLKPVLG